MSNRQSLELIDLAVDRVETELSFFDANTRHATAYQKTVDSLKTDISALHSNDAGLDTKVRVSKLTTATSGLAIAESDLRAALDVVAGNRADALEAGKTAAALLFETRDLLVNQRQKNVEAWLTAQFDWTQIPVVRPKDFAVAHQSVRAIASLGVTNLRYELTHDDDFTLRALRRLGAHWAELKPLVEAEPNLILNVATAKPAPVAAPVAQRQPATAAAVAFAA